MTPKEKANNLCMRFLIQTSTDIPYGVNKTIAKECALIAVDEILEATVTEYQIQYDNGEWSREIGYRYSEFWQQVKQEIEKL